MPLGGRGGGKTQQHTDKTSAPPATPSKICVCCCATQRARQKHMRRHVMPRAPHSHMVPAQPEKMSTKRATLQHAPRTCLQGAARPSQARDTWQKGGACTTRVGGGRKKLQLHRYDTVLISGRGGASCCCACMCLYTVRNCAGHATALAALDEMWSEGMHFAATRGVANRNEATCCYLRAGEVEGGR